MESRRSRDGPKSVRLMLARIRPRHSGGVSQVRAKPHGISPVSGMLPKLAWASCWHSKARLGFRPPRLIKQVPSRPQGPSPHSAARRFHPRLTTAGLSSSPGLIRAQVPTRVRRIPRRSVLRTLTPRKAPAPVTLTPISSTTRREQQPRWRLMPR